MEYIEKNADLRRTAISNMNQFSRFSLWSTACSKHCWIPFKNAWENDKETVPMESEHTVRDAVERFVFNQQRVTYGDEVKWPGNKPCAY